LKVPDGGTNSTYDDYLFLTHRKITPQDRMIVDIYPHSIRLICKLFLPACRKSFMKKANSLCHFLQKKKTAQTVFG
jgi:hypothetical protein